MSRGQVRHMDIIPDAGAVRRRIIRAVNRNGAALSQGSFQNQRDQMALRGMVFTHSARRQRPRSIEIPQRHMGKSVRHGEIRQHPFDDPLRASVDIGRPQRRILADGTGFRLAVHRCRGREHHLPDICPVHRLQQRQRRRHIVPVVFRRIDHRLADLACCSKMHHGINRIFFEGFSQSRRIADVRIHERNLCRYCGAMSLHQTIVHHDPMSGRQQFTYRMRPDIPGPACHQHTHISISRPTVFIK